MLDKALGTAMADGAQPGDVMQSRNGKVIWTGRIECHNHQTGSVGDSFGRRLQNEAEHQWQTNDVITFIDGGAINRYGSSPGMVFNFDWQDFPHFAGHKTVVQKRHGVEVWSGQVHFWPIRGEHSKSILINYCVTVLT